MQLNNPNALRASSDCRYCERGTLAHPTQPHCGQINCRMAWQKEQQQATAAHWKLREHAHKQDLETRYRHWRDKNNYDETQIAMVEVPSCSSTPEPLNDERRDLFLAHIQCLLESLDSTDTEVTFTPPYDTPTPDAIAPYLGKLCAHCNGRCCNKGNANHAFIQRSTLQRVLKNVSGVTKNAVLARYEAALPSHAVKDSCVFHTEQGCCLPGELRANICDEFFCLNLNQFIERFDGKGAPERVLAFSVDGCEVQKETEIVGV